MAADFPLLFVSLFLTLVPLFCGILAAKDKLSWSMLFAAPLILATVVAIATGFYGGAPFIKGGEWQMMMAVIGVYVLTPLSGITVGAIALCSWWRKSHGIT